MGNKRNKDFYITLLEYIHERTGEGKTVESSEVYDYVRDQHPTIAGDAINRTLAHAVEPVWDEARTHRIGSMLTMTTFALAVASLLATLSILIQKGWL